MCLGTKNRNHILGIVYTTVGVKNSTSVWVLSTLTGVKNDTRILSVALPTTGVKNRTSVGFF